MSEVPFKLEVVSLKVYLTVTRDMMAPMDPATSIFIKAATASTNSSAPSLVDFRAIMVRIEIVTTEKIYRKAKRKITRRDIFITLELNILPVFLVNSFEGVSLIYLFPIIFDSSWRVNNVKVSVLNHVDVANFYNDNFTG